MERILFKLKARGTRYLLFVLALFLHSPCPAQSPAEMALVPQGSTGKVTFSTTIKKVAPAVVNVYCTKKIAVKSPLSKDPLFRDFFKDSAPKAHTHQEEDLGSGVIVSPDGYILTNFHVVEGAQEVQIVMADEREFTASVVGADAATDLALLKINSTNLPVAVLGNSDETEIGDVVLAIGNPFGVGQTVTLGIVSATDRGGFGIVDYEDFIQVDAAINPGNSGGALSDSQGRVIGINTAMLSSSGCSHGIGFAVPINLARYVMDQILREGRVIRGNLGLSIQPLTPGLARHFGMPDQHGALIDDVTPRSPASLAGIKPGDVIIDFNGKKVTNPRRLRLHIGETKPGTRVNLTVLRDGEPLTMTAVLKEIPQPRKNFEAPEPVDQPTQTQSDVLDGVIVTDLEKENRRRLQIASSVQGALVLHIENDSSAFAAGLRPGDVIQEINRQPTKDSYQAVEVSRKTGGSEDLLLRVWNQGNSRYLNVSKDVKKPQPPPALIHN